MSASKVRFLPFGKGARSRVTLQHDNRDCIQSDSGRKTTVLTVVGFLTGDGDGALRHRVARCQRAQLELPHDV